jgi:hypothetical protein
MIISSTPTILFFRVYREAALPLYAALVEQLCDSADLPFQLATVLEDIGQEFIRLGASVNAALERLGVLEREVDADLTVEAQIDALLAQLPLDRLSSPADHGIPGLMSIDESLRQALRIALVMTHDLPVARGT